MLICACTPWRLSAFLRQLKAPGLNHAAETLLALPQAIVEARSNVSYIRPAFWSCSHNEMFNVDQAIIAKRFQC